MKIVVAGAGTVGLQLAKQLIGERHNVVIIEQQAARARYVSERMDCLVINDSANNLETLRSASVGKAEFFISVTDSDEVNIITCAMVHGEFDVPYKIARVRNIDYSFGARFASGLPGVDYIVNPEIEAAKAIIRSIDVGAVSEVTNFERSDMQMRTLTVGERSPLLRRSLIDIGRNARVPFLVALIMRNEEALIPSGDTVIEQGDILHFVATERNLAELFQRIGQARSTLRNIMLLGGGKIGRHLAEHLVSRKHQPTSILKRILRTFAPVPRRTLTIFERDREKCRQLAEKYPDALVINADITEDEIFAEERGADLLIAATENEELNIVSSAYAKTMGVDRSIVLVSKYHYARIAAQLGIDVVVSMKNTVVSSILRYIRRGNVGTIHAISDAKVEAIELTVAAESRVIGEPIHTLRLPESTLLVSISRNGNAITPSGENVLEANDHVIIITRQESVDKVQALFTRSA